MHTFGIYRKGLRHLARRLKDGKPSAIMRTAELMAKELPNGSVVVPMPSHLGRATVMLSVALRIAELRHDIRVIDALEVAQHQGMYVAKRSGNRLPHLTMRLICDLPSLPICVIDNVIDTGTTFSAAQAALGDAELYAVAHTTERSK